MKAVILYDGKSNKIVRAFTEEQVGYKSQENNFPNLERHIVEIDDRTRISESQVKLRATAIANNILSELPGGVISESTFDRLVALVEEEILTITGAN